MKKFKIFTLFLLTMSMFICTAACGEKIVEIPEQNQPKETLTQNESENTPEHPEDKNPDCPDCPEHPERPEHPKHKRHKRRKRSQEPEKSDDSKKTFRSEGSENASDSDDEKIPDIPEKPRQGVRLPKKLPNPIHPVPLPQPNPQL